MNKVLADILDRPVPKGLSIPKVQALIKEVAMLDTNSKLVYSASGERIIKELDKYGVKDIPQNYRGVLLEHWLELLSQNQETVTEVPRPTGPDATTLTSDQLTDLGESAEKRTQQKTTIQAREKEAVARFKETGEKRYQDQQREEALKEKQAQELLNQFFKKVGGKVVVVPVGEILEVQLTKENKEVLLATEIAAKEDPATTQKVFEEKIQLALNNSKQEYKDSIKGEEIKKTATHLVETLRNLPDHKSIDEIPDNPKSLNTLSIINPLSNPNSPEMIAMIPDKESREEFAKKVQTLMLTAEGKRVIDLAGARAIFGEGGESIIYSLYGPDTITDFKISNDEKDRDEGVEIDPQAVYEKGKQVYNFINKVRQAKSAEEVTSTALAYYPTYTYSGVTTATKTVSTLTKALPAVGAVYSFRQGTLLAHWAKSGTPLLSAGNQNLVRLLTSQASVQEIASASLVTFSRPIIAFESGGVKVLLVTGTNKALGTQIAVGGVKFGQKMAGAIAVKGGTQIAVVTGTQAGGQLAVGASTVLTKVLTFLGGLSTPVTAGIGLVVGYLAGKVIEKLPQIKKWFQENGPVLAGVAGLGGLALGGPAVGGLVLFGGLAATGSLAAFATGAFGVLGLIGRSIGIAIATPVIVTLLVLPPLVAFIMLVINNSAYVVPPSPYSSSLNGGADNPYMLVTKTANPTKLDNSSSNQTVIYVVSIKALKGNLTNLKLVSTECSVIKKDKSKVECPTEFISDLDGASITPGNDGVFSFTGIYGPKYSDSLIYDRITISATNEAGEEITTSGSESVCIGNCPTDCLTVEGTWPAQQKLNIEKAREYIIANNSDYVAHVCSQYPDGLPLKYGGSNGNLWGYFKGTHLLFYGKGTDSESNAIYTLAHEMLHALVTDLKAVEIYLKYIASSAITETPRCFYSYEAYKLEERLADAVAFSIMPVRYCSITGKDSNINQWPKHRDFILKEVFNVN